MSFTQNTEVGKTTDFSAEEVLGLITQNPESTRSKTAGRAVNSDLAIGVPFTIVARTVTAAALKAPTTYTATVFNKNCPFKLEILSIRVKLVSYTQADWTDGDGGNLDVTVQDGDGAASESFTDVLADQAWDDTYTNGLTIAYPSSTVALTNTTIDEDESLKCLCIADPDDTVVGAAGAGACTFDFIIECMRVN